MAITNNKEWLHFNSIMILNILISNSYQYNFIFISLLVLKIGKKYFSPEGGCLIMAMSTGACWGGHFCVEPGIFVSNRAFLCRTMHFAVEPGSFVSNECYNAIYYCCGNVPHRTFHIWIIFSRYLGLFMGIICMCGCGWHAYMYTFMHWYQWVH